MPDRPASPRLPPLSPEGQAPDIAAVLDATRGAGNGPAGATNIFATLAHHPGLLRKWLPFGGKLLAGKLPPRDRELLILRTGWNTRADYEWHQHVRIARAVGVTDEEIERVQTGSDAPGWSAGDALLLRAADELHADACITDATWAALAERYDDRQLVEVPMLVGHYHMVAFTLNALGVEREPGVPGFDR